MDREISQQERAHPHDLARSLEWVIKSQVSERFSASLEDLSLLLDDEDGVYMSQEDPNVLCCLVVDQKTGFMYLVAGKLDMNQKQLEDLKADIVS